MQFDSRIVTSDETAIKCEFVSHKIFPPLTDLDRYDRRCTS